MTAVSNTVPFVDVQAPGFRFDHEGVAAARRQHWYARTEHGPLVLRYADATKILADRRLSPTGAGHLALHGISSGPIHDYFSINLSSRAADDHARLRALLTRNLGRRELAEARAVAERKAGELSHQLAAQPGADFMTTFADPLVVSVFTGLLGIPVEDRDRFAPWSSDVGLVFGLSLAGLRTRLETDLSRLFEYFEDLLARRRTSPREDFVSALASARSEHDISEQQCLSTLVSVIMGAHDAPMHQLGCAVLALAEHPEQWEMLGRHPELAPQAVEEALRWSSHTHTTRFATRRFAYRDVSLEPGSAIIACNTSANRDPRAFDRADRFDITAERSTLGIAFGGGPFFCPGSMLAKMELEVALTTLTRRFQPPSVTGPVQWRPPTTTAFGPEVLPMRFIEQRGAGRY